MTKQTFWFREDEVKKRIIADKILLINIKSNTLLVLNKQASAIWDQLSSSEAHQESDIVKILQRQYANTPIQKLKIDIHNFLSTLQEKGLTKQNDKSLLQPPVLLEKKLRIQGHLSFSEQLHQLAAKYNIPISGGLEITQRCHLKCLHCYIDNQPITYKNELSTEEFDNLLDQMAKDGCLWLLITGGEPLLRNDFPHIYLHAKKLGMIITVFTNATKLTERIIELFTNYPPFLIEATLHGIKEATFDTISGVPGSFRQFKYGIQLLRDNDVPFHLKMIVMQQNINEVEFAHQFALDLGARDFRFDPMVNADFYHSSKMTNLRISVKEALRLDLLEPFRSRWKKIYRTALNKRATQPTQNNLLFPCRAGKCSFTISADGYLLPCILMRKPSYNLRQISFSRAWQKLNIYATTLQMKKNNLCLKCQVQTCPKCPAWGYLEHGDAEAKSQFACALQQEREKTFLH